jgi:hypothetical protein
MGFLWGGFGVGGVIEFRDRIYIQNYPTQTRQKNGKQIPNIYRYNDLLCDYIIHRISNHLFLF